MRLVISPRCTTPFSRVSFHFALPDVDKQEQQSLWQAEYMPVGGRVPMCFPLCLVTGKTLRNLCSSVPTNRDASDNSALKIQQNRHVSLGTDRWRPCFCDFTHTLVISRDTLQVVKNVLALAGDSVRAHSPVLTKSSSSVDFGGQRGASCPWCFAQAFGFERE